MTLGAMPCQMDTADSPTVEMLQREISRLNLQIVELKRKGSEWYQRAIAAEKRVGEYKAILANKNLSSSQALALYSTVKLVDTEKPREDGRVYINYDKVAESLPISSQSAGSALYTLAKNGIVDVVKERKKTGPGFNMFLSLPTQTRLNLAHVVVDNEETPRAGGKRIALHKLCGGECIERKKYLCKGCGMDNIGERDVLMISEESWRREQEEKMMEEAESVPMGKHPRGIACPGCHSLNHWYAVTTDWGGEMHYCGVCMPPSGGIAQKEGHDEMHL